MFVYVSSIITTRQYFIFQEKYGENSDWHYTGITIQQVTSLSRSSGIQRFPLSSQGQTNITFQVFTYCQFPTSPYNSFAACLIRTTKRTTYCLHIHVRYLQIQFCSNHNYYTFFSFLLCIQHISICYKTLQTAKL